MKPPAIRFFWRALYNVSYRVCTYCLRRWWVACGNPDQAPDVIWQALGIIEAVKGRRDG